MLNAQRFPFIEKSDRSGVINMMPYLPLTLTYQNRPLDVLGLLDTGSRHRPPCRYGDCIR